MIKYNFQINKDICFVYWVQNMIEWNWYFNKNEFEYYRANCGEFSRSEQEALEQLKEILRKPDNAYQWLWSRYADAQIKNESESEDWRRIKEVLSDKFEKVWLEEYPKLLHWLKILEDYSFTELSILFKKAEIFYGVDFEEEIAIQLSFGYSSLVPGGHVKKGLKNLILLNISNLRKDCVSKVASALSHETIHLIDYSSDKSELLKKSYLKIIKPIGITQEKPSWYYLMTESVITAIAGADFSYIDKKMNLVAEVNKTKTASENKFKCENDNYSRQIKITAKHLKPTTEEYFEDGREMDEPYANKVAQIWINLRENNIGK